MGRLTESEAGERLGFTVIDNPTFPQIQWLTDDGKPRGRRPALEPEVRMWRLLMGGESGTAG